MNSKYFQFNIDLWHFMWVHILVYWATKPQVSDWLQTFVCKRVVTCAVRAAIQGQKVTFGPSGLRALSRN